MLKELLHSQIKINDTQIDKLENFSNLLLEWNKTHNLTGAKDLKRVYDNILDSLLPYDFIDTPKRILDVGSGAGFPAIALAVIYPNTQVVLCEPRIKRVAFLRYVALMLNLKNVKVVASRVEKMKDKAFDLITSRAVTNTQMLLNLTSHLQNEQTKYLFYKGSGVMNELEDIDSLFSYKIFQKNNRNYLYIKSNHVA
ncbi:MAG: 16S rRNA (guanine(527)-N(7))-methyltransferase RsmG [Epsilonproteobacteria bacterium]|nr:16S rRNA (guanine(527)-N(7))-methyltransferase RsmG [Campylobacterota bacterium]MBD3839344.1 16S rRNA (guanine(527)-N(7))-methyltransferase RsmG [Campylobacterota bacterium]